MYKLLGGLKDYLKWQDITTDNAIFRLHNLFTTVLLLTCSLIITANQFVGNPIHCIVQGIPNHVINTYCWITSTYTMPDAFRRAVGVDVAHPGVANDFNDEDAKKYYTYYQWVCFVLFFQPNSPSTSLPRHCERSVNSVTPACVALVDGLLDSSKVTVLVDSGAAVSIVREDVWRRAYPNSKADLEGAAATATGANLAVIGSTRAMLCYTPKWLWDAWEGNLMRTIIMGLNVGMRSEEDKDKKKKVLIDYLLKHIKRHNMYAIRYWLCEFLCLVNIIGQLYMMNSFFDGEFMSYGLKVLSFSENSQEDRLDPMVYVFPRVTKCVFHKYGPSGTIQKHDSLCVLPLNIVNEKTYIFIWFWFVILATLLSCLLLYRAIILAVPSVRPYLLHARNRGTISREAAAAVSRKTDIGDWWVLYMLGRNIDPLIYREVIGELAKKIETAASNAS